MNSRLISILSACAIVFFGAVAASAQPQGGRGMDPGQFAKMRADEMKKAVQLTDDQYQKVVDLYTSEMDQMQKLRTQGERDSNRKAMQKAREESEAKLKTILTEDQFKKWSESERNHRPGQAR